MLCPRCGAVFEGNFCPQCGTPAAPPATAPAMAFSVTCPRCGTTFQGHFCPRCGLPAGAPAYAPPTALQPAPSGLRSVLSVLWTLAIAGVLVIMALNVTALLLSPTYVWPGIQSASQGRTANPGLDAGDGNWTFIDVAGTGSTGTYSATGGDPGGYLQMNLPSGPNVGGMWEQSFRVSGSTPYLADVRLGLQVLGTNGGPQAGRIVVSVESTPQGLSLQDAAVLWLNGTSAWTTTNAIDMSNAIAAPGTYYLKVAYLAGSTPSATLVGFDNVQLAWTTDAYFYVVAPFPVPLLLYYSFEPAQIAASYLFVIAAILLPAAYYTYRERKVFVRTFARPVEDLRSRLRSMSTWVAIAQAWLAVTCFQYAIILFLYLVGSPPTTPISETATNAWVLLYDLARASVFEELAFRLMLIGIPMAAASFVVRWARRPSVPTAGAVAPRGSRPVDSLRYLLGGQLRAESPREALLAGWILLLGSSAVFGMAHSVGWGDWKVIPAAVAGLAFGYLFLRHGIGAAILAHFLNDYLSAIVLENVGGTAMDTVVSFLLLGLIVLGAGFLAWYVIYGWQHFRDLLRRFGAHRVRQPVAAAPPSAPPGWSYAPPMGPPASGYSYAPPPPPSGSPAPPSSWSPLPAQVRNPAEIPRGYAPTYHPAPYGYPPVRFQCPYCGWVEARYDNRVFTCLRCGRTA